MMSEKEFVRIRDFIKSRYGIDLSNKQTIVSGRLENYIRTEGWNNYDIYMNHVEADKSGVLEKKLVDILTTNHTYFMRETEHFDYLKNVVLPYLKKKEARSRDLCIWCGASSTGEEPYTLAMILSEFFGMEKAQWDTKVLATDVSTRVLQVASEGRYSAEQVESLPDPWRRKYFHKSRDGQMYEVTRELKNEVLFRKFNLMEVFPFKRKMHVVFLRNVMIYFDSNTKRELIRKVYNALEPGGYLFIGQTETIDHKNIGLQIIQPSIFRKKEGIR